MRSRDRFGSDQEHGVRYRFFLIWKARIGAGADCGNPEGAGAPRAPSAVRKETRAVDLRNRHT